WWRRSFSVRGSGGLLPRARCGLRRPAVVLYQHPTILRRSLLPGSSAKDSPRPTYHWSRRDAHGDGSPYLTAERHVAPSQLHLGQASTAAADRVPGRIESHDAGSRRPEPRGGLGAIGAPRRLAD